jgi:hypothetical protein
MGIKISERVKLHHLEWDEVREDLLLREYAPTTWNTGTTEYNISLVNTYKVGGADYIDLYDFTSNSVTTIASTGVYYKVVMNAVSSLSKGFTQLANGRITKVGDGYKGPMKLQCNVAFQGSNNDEIHIIFYKNGYEISNSLSTKVLSGAGKGDTTYLQCLTTLDDGDYIELYVANISGARDVTLENVDIIVNELT